MKKAKLMLLYCVLLTTIFLFGCSGKRTHDINQDGKVFRYGTTAYGPEMGNAGLNPHDNYSGWSAVRYGVGETLFRFTNAMEPEPWLAVGYEQLDDYSVKIFLRDDVYFSSKRKMNGTAVKQCLEHLIANHDRAAGDLKIKEILAEELAVTIVSEEKAPVLINYLSDPYGAIIDLDYGITEDQNVSGTGPFIAEQVMDTEIHLVKNEEYWGGEVKMDRVEILSITDGDTLTMALQTGELDAAQGLPYASYPLFDDQTVYGISRADTSRTFFATMNYQTESLQDPRVRQAIAAAIDKKGFTEVLLNGNGSVAAGPFPADFLPAGQEVQALSYDPDQARELLREAGWTDTDGDGYVDQNGTRLTLRWLTYPSRQELPLLAEAVQASLKEIGIELLVNSTGNHLDFIDRGEWDLYASAFVTAPTGDLSYFFTTHALKESAKNRGQYENEELEELARQMAGEYDRNQRAVLAAQMSQILLDDGAFLFVSHLRMSIIMKSSVTGLNAHPSDYYEITADLDFQQQ